MDDELSYTVENEQQFWAGESRASQCALHRVLRLLSQYIDPLTPLVLIVELDDIVAAPHETHELIDNALRLFLGFTTTFKRMRLRKGT